MAGRLLASWGNKRPRTKGRRSTTTSPAPSSDLLSREEENCIQGLLMMSRDPRTPKQQEAPYPISFAGIMPLLPPPPLKRQQQQQQQQQNDTVALATADLRRYECSECGKAFSSYQALGGHKSIHRKRPGAKRLARKAKTRQGEKSSGDV